MTNKPMLSVERELLDRIARPLKKMADEPARRRAIKELRTLLDKPGHPCPVLLDGCDGSCAPAAKRQGEPVACMPVDRCYDVRAKMIIAFNEAKKAGGDLDDALDAAYKSALRYSPNPKTSVRPAPVAVVMPDRKTKDKYSGYIEPFQAEAAALYNSALDDVARLNGVTP